MNISNLMTPLVLPMIIIGLFYMLVIAPMRKRQRELQQMVENLKKGDKVITNSGIYGEVAAIDDTSLMLKVADNVRIKVAKSAISGKDSGAEKGGNS